MEAKAKDFFRQEVIMRKCAWIVATVLFLLSAIAIARADLIGDLSVNLHVDVYCSDGQGQCPNDPWVNTGWWSQGETTHTR